MAKVVSVKPAPVKAVAGKTLLTDGTTVPCLYVPVAYSKDEPVPRRKGTDRSPDRDIHYQRCGGGRRVIRKHTRGE